MRGSITDLAPGSYSEMTTVFMSSDRDSNNGQCLSKNERLQFLPRSCFQTIYETAFCGLGQDATPRNKHGQPLATVCVLQPFSETSSIAILDMQRAVGTSQEKHDVRGFVVCGGDQNSKLDTYLLQELVEAWVKSEIDVPGHARIVARAFKPNQEETKMEHRLSFVDPSGKLQLAEIHLKKFLDHLGTAAQAEEFSVDWRKQMSNSDAPVWVASPSLESTHPVPKPASEPSLWQASYKSLQELKGDTFIAECSSYDSKLNFVVNNKRELWAHVLTDVNRAEGVREISFGRGKRRDKARLEDCSDCVVIPIVCTTDESVVFYKQDTCVLSSYVYHTHD